MDVHSATPGSKPVTAVFLYIVHGNEEKKLLGSKKTKKTKWLVL
jgi:hypothetical protein